jgi:methylmalonyl-CoA mutase N-terminal domain/subunit
MVRCLDDGWIQRRISERAFEYQRNLESGAVPVVGVNRFKAEKADSHSVEIHRNDPVAERAKVSELRELRAKRDADRVGAALDALERAARGDSNLMVPIKEAVLAYSTVGEIADRLRKVFGEYQAPRGSF